MIKPIIKDPFFLSQKSDSADKNDLQVVIDLQDTLRAHHNDCVGMAANMIGVRKRIIIVSMGPMDVVMINPVITAKSGAYQTEEGCLSLQGVRSTTRYEKITVSYQDASFIEHKQEYSGWIAQIIQHECDHLEGVLI